MVQMNYPKEFYVSKPIVGDKVWLDLAHFIGVKTKAFHGPYWIKDVYSGQKAVRLMRENGPECVVSVDELLRMPKGQIKVQMGLKTV